MKEIIFDMDGTIADLYSVTDWLPKLRAEDPSPYKEASPLYDMESLAIILKILKNMGYTIKVVSWGSKGASREYDKAVTIAKKEWLDRYNFPYDELNVVPYGTPKEIFVSPISDISILIDDNKEVRDDFIKAEDGVQKVVIDATKNIMLRLTELLVA